ncbi:AbrB/MazE/SpoVT family DNA-binding domain-containing protein [Candidatus Omnitrophota bacterium]
MIKSISKGRKRVSKKKVKSSGAYFRMALMSSRGQVTVPQDIREIMHIKRGSVVGFEPTQRGVLMVAMKVEPQDPYTDEEWQKIEKLSKGDGTVYKSAEEAKRHIADL